jgi:hypothetical protein
MQHRATSTAHQVFAYTRLLQVRRAVDDEHNVKLPVMAGRF